MIADRMNRKSSSLASIFVFSMGAQLLLVFSQANSIKYISQGTVNPHNLERINFNPNGKAHSRLNTLIFQFSKRTSLTKLKLYVTDRAY